MMPVALCRAHRVTIAATSTARAQLVAWRDAREKAIPDECGAKCKADARAVACFDACILAERAPVERVNKALVGYRMALEASAAGAAGDADAAPVQAPLGAGTAAAASYLTGTTRYAARSG